MSRVKLTMDTTRDARVLSAFDELVISFSGGKDSLACLLWAIETDKPLRVIFADTGNELPDSPEYFEYLKSALGIKIESYKRNGHSFFDLVRKRGMWPMHGRCLISSTVKREDFRYYINNNGVSKSALIVLGQRRSESAKRSKLPYFSEIIRSGRACYRPILDWSIDDVFSFIDRHGIKAHPAYGNGRNRVGCVWCVHSKTSELVRDEQLYPERCQQLRELRQEIGLSSIPAGVEQLTMFNEPPLCKYSSVHCE